MVKNPPANAGAKGRHRFDPWVGKIPWRGKWQSCLVFLPGEVHGQRSLVVYSPRGRGKKISFHKECCFGPPGLSPPSHAFSKEQDLAGAFLHKCKYNYYLCISIHPQVVKDNTTALTITIPPFSCPAELQMLLH